MKAITACTKDCSDACSLVFEKDPQGRMMLRGNPDSPFTSGFTCPKVKDFVKRLHHPDRLLHPMLRKGDTWQTISWPAALDLCADKIQQLRSEPKSILHIQGEGAKGVLKKATTLFAVEFKVVVDAFMNDTAQLADLILPSTLMLENEDIVGSFLHEYVQRVKQVSEAPGGVREDLWILSEIGKRLDPPIELPDPETCLKKALDTPFLDTTLETLDRQLCARSNRPAIPYDPVFNVH